jgi:2-C-methyl-D-erythritol 4-phosphate cytidylyltransferase
LKPGFSFCAGRIQLRTNKPIVMRLTALIPAAGSGRRMQSGINKQYLELAGQPILAHTLRLFDEHPAVGGIWLIASAAELDYCRTEVVEHFGFSKIRGIITGGAERQDSVRNGLRACPAAPDELVLIHDGARPLLNRELIDRVASAASSFGAAVVGAPVKDTIKQVGDNRNIISTPPRDTLWLAQTPQAFRYEIILAAHEKAFREGYRGTDDASLVEWNGGTVVMVEGDYRNLKITTPEDLVLARALLGQTRVEA